MKTTRSRIEVSVHAPEPQTANGAIHCENAAEVTNFAQFVAAQASRATIYTTPEALSQVGKCRCTRARRNHGHNQSGVEQ